MQDGVSRRVTLSFDNGPDPEGTPLILDTLAKYGIKATFFVIGEKLVEYRALTERAADEGHWIGNHTWSHSQTFTDRGDAAFVSAEIDRTEAEIGSLAQPVPLFRPFGGGGFIDRTLNRTAADHLMAAGYTCVVWNAIPRDFADPDGWVETGLAQAAESEWVFPVLHDHHPRAMRHLDRFLSALSERGHEFRQDHPDDSILIRAGRPTALLEQILPA